MLIACIYNPIIGPSYLFVYIHWMGLILVLFLHRDGLLNNENDLSLVFLQAGGTLELCSSDNITFPSSFSFALPQFSALWAA